MKFTLLLSRGGSSEKLLRSCRGKKSHKHALERGKEQEEWREQMTNEIMSLPQTCPHARSEPYPVPPQWQTPACMKLNAVQLSERITMWFLWQGMPGTDGKPGSPGIAGHPGEVVSRVIIICGHLTHTGFQTYLLRTSRISAC